MTSRYQFTQKMPGLFDLHQGISSGLLGESPQIEAMIKNMQQRMVRKMDRGLI